MCEGQDRESPARRWLALCVEEVSSRARTKGFPLLNISVGLLFVAQSGIGVLQEGEIELPREIANKNNFGFQFLCFSNLFLAER